MWFFVFDYKRLADGTTLNPGTVYHLPADNWLIDKSPMSLIDSVPEPKHQGTRTWIS